MRVDYTLPALQPDTMPEMPSPEGGLSFREHLAMAVPAARVSCEQQLRLDLRPFTATYIGPPPRPQRLQLQGPEMQRARWHNMVQRHSLDDVGDPGSGDSNAVAAMLELLIRTQQMEDAILAQQVAVTRG